MTRIKICGLSREEDIANVNEAGPDYCGFIIQVPRSRRNVSPERAAELSIRLDGRITPVGVFVNAPAELPARLAREGIIRMIQLHGQEDEDYIQRLRCLTDVPVIQAFSVASREDVRRAKDSSADYVLFDQGAGGTGKTFDWGLIGSMDRPFILAGVLTLENLTEAVKRVRPWCVDVSSGVETEGYKDQEKIKAAVAAVRRMEE